MPFYVGKGRKARATSNNGRNAHWKNIVAKDGGRHVEFIAQNIDNELALLVEMEAIDQFRRLGIVLTNLTDGGDGTTGYVLSDHTKIKIASKARGRIHSDETRQKMSDAQRARTNWVFHDNARKALLASHLGVPSPLRGRTHTDETKLKLRKAWETRRLTPDSAETRAKKRAAMLGRVRSEATRAKLYALKTGKRLSEESRQLRLEKMRRKLVIGGPA
jgi:hypothetical protein